MKLFCYSCSELHAFTAGDLERIVYALQGDLADTILIARSRDKNDTEALSEGTECLLSILEGSKDIERYAEWTEGNVEARREDGGRL